MALFVHLPDVCSTRQTHDVQPWHSADIAPVPRGGDVGLHVEWMDQGWGNRKGAIHARVATARGVELLPWRRVGPYPAPHDFTVVDITLPREFFSGRFVDALLELGFEVGGGGGHALNIRDAWLYPAVDRLMSHVCSVGHSLDFKTLGVMEGWVHERECDRCGLDIPMSEPRLHCPLCDYDLCLSCARAESDAKSDAPAESNAPAENNAPAGNNVQ